MLCVARDIPTILLVNDDELIKLIDDIRGSPEESCGCPAELRNILDDARGAH